MWFSTSWDDGHPLDLRLADLLARHGFAGTFYVPQNNSEGLPVMSAAELRQLDGRFEIGSHTLDHRYSNRVPATEWQRQVREGKRALEDGLGHAVPGFCYPGGRFTKHAKAAVRDAGFTYARTVSNLHLNAGSDRFLIPTTLQFYPHPASVLARNWLRAGHWRARWPAARLAWGQASQHQRLMALLEATIRRDGTFHLWGHSWELERCALWADLDAFLRDAASLVPPQARICNSQLAATLCNH